MYSALCYPSSSTAISFAVVVLVVVAVVILPNAILIIVLDSLGDVAAGAAVEKRCADETMNFNSMNSWLQSSVWFLIMKNLPTWKFEHSAE